MAGGEVFQQPPLTGFVQGMADQRWQWACATCGRHGSESGRQDAYRALSAHDQADHPDRR